MFHVIVGQNCIIDMNVPCPFGYVFDFQSNIKTYKTIKKSVKPLSYFLFQFIENQYHQNLIFAFINLIVQGSLSNKLTCVLNGYEVKLSNLKSAHFEG